MPPQGFVQQWALRDNAPRQLCVNEIAVASRPSGAPPDVLERFLKTITVLVSMGFFVLLDNQLQQDKLAQVRPCRRCAPQIGCL